MNSADRKTRINEQIRAPKIRLVDADGNQCGVVSNEEAQRIRLQAELDLVEVSPEADPPVCRIMDYGKYVYRQGKRKAKTKQVQKKEVKFRPGTEEGDYQVKKRKIIAFLEKGNKVKVTVRFRGREMAHQKFGQELLTRLQEDLVEYGYVEQEFKLEGRQMAMGIAPKRKK